MLINFRPIRGEQIERVLPFVLVIILYRGTCGQSLRALLGNIYGGPEESGQHVDGSGRHVK
jgi:hypothetical protein